MNAQKLQLTTQKFQNRAVRDGPQGEDEIEIEDPNSIDDDGHLVSSPEAGGTGENYFNFDHANPQFQR